jgi:acetyl esterase/lipase
LKSKTSIAHNTPKMRLFTILLFSIFTTFSTCLKAQEVMKLWPESIPFSNGTFGEEEYTDAGHVRNIQNPTITIYLPDKAVATGASVVICPGGGYRLLAIQHEGHDVARWLNGLGIAGIVLKNRLPTSENITDTSLVALTDALRAMQMVRHYSDQWGLKADQVGIMGFSVGGHLASAAGTLFEMGTPALQDEVQKQKKRPDFMILIYPVITMSENFMHRGSMRNLLGSDQSPERQQRFSTEKQVTDRTPPTILIHSSDDKAVPVANSIAFYEALIEHKVPAELHVFNSGGHGYGLGRRDGRSHNLWTKNVELWLHDIVLK